MSWDDPDVLDTPHFTPSGPAVGRVRLSPLQVFIVELRAIVGSEVPTRLHTQRLTDDDHPDEGGIGMPFTSYMHRYIGHWSHWGQSRLAELSIMEVSDWCHARHTSHSIPGATRSLCAAALHALSRGKEPEELAALKGLASLHGMRRDQLESMLEQALRHAADWRVGQERRPEGARFDGPDPLPYEPLRLTRGAAISHS